VILVNTAPDLYGLIYQVSSRGSNTNGSGFAHGDFLEIRMRWEEIVGTERENLAAASPSPPFKEERAGERRVVLFTSRRSVREEEIGVGFIHPSRVQSSSLRVDASSPCGSGLLPPNTPPLCSRRFWSGFNPHVSSRNE